MRLETVIKNMDRDSLIILILRIVDQFPIIKDQLIRMFNDKDVELWKK